MMTSELIAGALTRRDRKIPVGGRPVPTIWATERSACTLRWRHSGSKNGRIMACEANHVSAAPSSRSGPTKRARSDIPNEQPMGRLHARRFDTKIGQEACSRLRAPGSDGSKDRLVFL